MTPINRFFLYDEQNTNICIAANHYLYEVMKYYENGRKVFFGIPFNHHTDITQIVSHTKNIYTEYKNACNDLETLIQLTYK